MKQGSTIFLRLVVYLIAAVVLGLCVFLLPAGIKSDQTGMYKPILISLYIPAIPFFFALYQALKLLNYIDQSKAFSKLTVKVLKNIKYCAVVITTLFLIGMPYIYYVGEIDDAPGVIALGLVIIFASTVVATFSAVLQKLLQNAVAIKEENDLTV